MRSKVTLPGPSFRGKYNSKSGRRGGLLWISPGDLTATGSRVKLVKRRLSAKFYKTKLGYLQKRKYIIEFNTLQHMCQM